MKRVLLRQAIINDFIISLAASDMIVIIEAMVLLELNNLSISLFLLISVPLSLKFSEMANGHYDDK